MRTVERILSERRGLGQQKTGGYLSLPGFSLKAHPALAPIAQVRYWDDLKKIVSSAEELANGLASDVELP